MEQRMTQQTALRAEADGRDIAVPQAAGVRATATVLAVDDEEVNRRLLATLLRAEGYGVLEASDGPHALDIAAVKSPDLVLLDIMMPDMDGYEVARQLKRRPETQAIPIIMVTALADRASRLRGLEAGAEEFVTKPVDSAELRVRVRNLVRLKEFSDFLANHNRILDAQVKERTRELRQSHREAICAVTAAAEYKDADSGAHIRRIGFYASLLAEALETGAEFADPMFNASPLHDVGKSGIPDEILLKQGPLTPAEWEIMKTHAELGAKILAAGRSAFLKLGAKIALTHHERWDGTGYPYGLKGEKIPLAGRIVSLCDQYDTLRSRRPHRPAFDHDRAFDIIVRGDGRTDPAHFDPAVLDAFKHCTPRFRDIFEAHRDER